MFDLVSKGHKPASPGDLTPQLVSWALHAILITGVVVPLLFATGEMPEVPDMMAFVGAPVAPPPPPPPPVPAMAKAVAPKPVPTSGSANAAPIDAPAEIRPEPAVETASNGVPGGVEGGVPGGVIDGVLGGLGDAPPPPPPVAPPPPAPKTPVRAGGDIQPPALVKRVDPVYPEIAMAANMEGMVILEAVVGTDGHVESVSVLRGIPLLDNAAKAAVMQWQYAPLLLNGKPERFILTVTVTFRLKRT